ncbi:hypothetical protein HLM50_12780 [Sulfitobacter sp. Ks41]|uniref:hypothetical protein n=1 Tax=Sulfitobacter sp. Ks41 TaxID=2731139 RepID=UPI0023E2D4C3|nr:hypothetical protein [Sulfitobacter sp. Ks41]MDF3361940.1 hypothetical protein [Sulfitobacter sp. Ks41]
MEILAEMSDDLLQAAQVCEILSIGRLELMRRRDTGRIIAILVETEFLYPAWQLEDGKVLPGIETFLSAYPGYDPICWVDMLLAPDPMFGDRNLLQVIKDGDSDLLQRYILQNKTDGHV